MRPKIFRSRFACIAVTAPSILDRPLLRSCGTVHQLYRSFTSGAMPLSYRTQMNGLHATPPAAGPSYARYTGLKMFTVIVQIVGLIAAYLLGLFYNYERLAITGCPVSSLHAYALYNNIRRAAVMALKITRGIRTQLPVRHKLCLGLKEIGKGRQRTKSVSWWRFCSHTQNKIPFIGQTNYAYFK